MFEQNLVKFIEFGSVHRVVWIIDFSSVFIAEHCFSVVLRFERILKSLKIIKAIFKKHSWPVVDQRVCGVHRQPCERLTALLF